jgi:hypothetical protein
MRTYLYILTALLLAPLVAVLHAADATSAKPNIKWLGEGKLHPK